MITEEDDGVAIPPSTGRRRRMFTEAFKTEAIEYCLQLGVSMAAVARAYDLHPNLLRRWVVAHQQAQKRAEEIAKVVQADDPPLQPPLETTTKVFVPLQRVNNIAGVSSTRQHRSSGCPGSRSY